MTLLLLTSWFLSSSKASIFDSRSESSFESLLGSFESSFGLEGGFNLEESLELSSSEFYCFVFSLTIVGAISSRRPCWCVSAIWLKSCCAGEGANCAG